MTTLTARLKQSPVEVRRYVLDYTMNLSPGESVVSVAANITQNAGAATPPLVVTGITLLPPVAGAVLGAVYLVSGGVDGGQYEVRFLATTSVGQILEDVAAYAVSEKV